MYLTCRQRVAREIERIEHKVVIDRWADDGGAPPSGWFAVLSGELPFKGLPEIWAEIELEQAMALMDV